MKNRYYILIIALAMLLCSCSGVKTDGLSEDDLIFTYNGTQYPLDTDVHSLLEALGDSYDMTEAVSCMFEGMDREFEFDDAIITTYPMGEEDLMDEIVLMSDRFETPRGITVGSSKQEIIDAYGEDYTDDGMVIKYMMDDDDMFSPQIYFVMQDDKVTSFSFYNPSDTN